MHSGISGREAQRKEVPQRRRPRFRGLPIALAVFTAVGCSTSLPPNSEAPTVSPQSAQQTSDPNDLSQTTQALQKRVVALQEQGQYGEAIPLAKEILRRNERAFPQDHPEVATAMLFLALLYSAEGDRRNAEPLYEQLLAIQQAAPANLGTAATIDQLGDLYLAQSEFEQAESHYQRALSLRESLRGPQHVDVAISLNRLGKLADSRAEYEQAKQYFQRALDIRKETLPANDPDVAAVLSNLATVYYSQADYEQAEQLFRQALAIEEHASPMDPSAIATTLSNLAMLRQKQGYYADAEYNYRRALDIQDKARVKNRRAVAASLGGLATLYQARAEYGRAEPMLRKVLDINEQQHGSGHPKVADSLNNLALLLVSLGDLEGAEPLHAQALDIRVEVFGRHNHKVAESLNNLATLNEAKGELTRADSLYREAARIYEQTLGEDHPDTQAVMGNIAGLLLEQGKLHAAFEILRRESWPTGLGRYFLLKGDYHAAYAQFVLAASAADKAGAQHHLLASQIGLGLTLEGLDRPDLATDNYRYAVELIEKQRSAISPAGRTRFLSGRVGAGFPRIAAYEGLIRSHADIGDKVEAMRWAEHTKARQLLDATARTRTAPGLPAALAAEEERLVTRISALRRQRDTALLTNPELARTIDRVQLPRAESHLTRFVDDQLRSASPAYAAYKHPKPLGPHDIVLGPREALIEYTVTEDEIFAWVVRNNGIVKLTRISIGREELAERVREYRSLFKGIGSTSDLRSDRALGKQLYDLLLKDSLPYCKPADRLVIVPDGVLGLLPFEALIVRADGPDTPVRYLDEDFPVQYAQSATVLSNARTLTRETTRKREELLVLADPVFDSSDARVQSGSPQRADPDAHSVRRMRAIAEDMTGTLHLPRLRMTGALLEELQDRFGAERVTQLSGLRASESALRAQALQAYRYLVFATHGFLDGHLRYLQEPALVLSQIGVSSANPSNDGFLTMTEVMDLSIDAELAALTACDTGVGESVDGEGVMGMGWAFQYAGARNVLMSLWSVEEIATVRLTEAFFEQLDNEKVSGPREALRLARSEVRKAGRTHPFFWAPFILMGEG